MKRIVVLVCVITAIIVPSVVSGASFQNGDLYLLSSGLPQGLGILRIEPLTGHTSLLTTMSTMDFPYYYPSLTYDPFRERLLHCRFYVDGGVLAVDADGNSTTLVADLGTHFIAARDNGIVYLWHGTGTGFRYVDAADNLHDLLNVAGTARYDLPAGVILDEMIYDKVTNSIICFTRSTFGDCDTPSDVCCVKIPLTPAGTQVAGPVECVEVYVSDATTRVTGSGRVLTGGILFVIDTNSIGAEPRMQLLDPVAMTVSSFAWNSNTGSACTDAGTFSNMLDRAVIVDTFDDYLRKFDYLESSAGAIVADSVSAPSSHSEDARLVEILTIWSAGVGDDGAPKASWMLYPAVPNPMNPTARIDFSIGAPGKVTLRIFDVSGRIIRTLVDDVRGVGEYSIVWDGKDEQGQRVASGVFLYQLDSPSYRSAKKIVIVH